MYAEEILPQSLVTEHHTPGILNMFASHVVFYAMLFTNYRIRRVCLQPTQFKLTNKTVPETAKESR